MKQGSSRTAVAVGAVIAAVGIFIALLVVLANRQGAADVAAHGTAAIRAEATLSAASAARNAAAQAALLAQAADAGAADPSAVAGAADDLEAFVAELERRYSATIPAISGSSRAAALEDATASLVDRLGEVSRLLRTAESSAVVDAVLAIEAPYGEATTLLVEERNARSREIDLAGQSSGRVADGARFLVAFIVPLAALLAYRRATRTRRRRLELEASLEQEREISRSKDEFVANLSHELRTPLTGIYGFALTMEEGSVEEEMRTELASQIANESGELLRMVEDLLAVGKIEADSMFFEIEDVKIGAEVHSVVEAFSHQPKPISVDVHDSVVSADPLRIRQVVRNLISNAVKHGGDAIEVVGFEGDRRYVLEVRDDGDGVPDEIEARLFERYVHRGATPLLIGSVGLGLAIAHTLAEGMGAEINYRRSRGKTIFEMTVPYPIVEPATADDVR